MSTELVESIHNKIEKVLDHEIPQRHSYFQLKYFIIGKEPTNQARMNQCLKEIKARKESLENLELEVEDVNDNIELSQIEINELLKIKENNRIQEIKIRKIKRNIIQSKKRLNQLFEQKKGIEEEILFFIQTFENIEKIEPLRNFDDLDVQKQYWATKLNHKLNMKLLSRNPLDTELIETIAALPDDMTMKNAILGALNNKLLSEKPKNED